MRPVAWLLAGALVVPASAAIAPVHVNQAGYAAGDRKWVAVGLPHGSPAPGSFEVRRATGGVVVTTGPLALRRASDPASGDDVYSGDFTALATEGDYFVRVAGTGDSPAFAIRATVYDDLYRRLIHGLTMQRCGTAVTAAVGGAWTHASCHDHGAGIASYDWASTGGPPSGYRNTIGGWHDAGDYGKYSTNNAYTIGLLLQAYEEYPARFARDDCNIPESGNGRPDLLDEARWSLQWMLTMQDADGSVRHRESIAAYAGMFLPESDPITRYYTDISSDATAVHCAAMAIAARVYAAADPALASACAASATLAWSWLAANPARVPTGGFFNRYGHTGATYIAGSEVARRLWAAAEVFRQSGSASAQAFVDAHCGASGTFSGVWYPDGWGDVANLAAFSYRDAPGATPGIVSGNWWSIENSTLSSCAQWNARIAADGYGCVAAAAPPYGDYYWGFTGVVLRYAWTLLEGYRYSGITAYRDAAREALHYIMGRNPMGKVYVTGVGTRPVLHSHGAWNTAAGYTAIPDSLCHPVPDLLVGGPNAADNPISPYPARCYEDSADADYGYLGNYTLNETAINIQASLIVLAGYFSTETRTGVAAAGGDSPESALDAKGTGALAVTAVPNPFGGQTVLRWAALPRSRGADSREPAVIIVSAAGRRVARLIGRPVSAGVAGAGAITFEASWNGRTADGRDAGPGVYFARAEGARGAPRRIVLLR